MSNEFMVEVRNVNKVFHTRHFFQQDPETLRRVVYEKRTVQAARQVSFGIKSGEIFGLLGPNGAGKTTTVKMISGLVRPTAGAVYVDNLDVGRKRLKALRKVGVVLEGTRTSIWPLTPLENLAYYGNLKDVRGAVLKQRSHDLINFIGLRDKMNVQVRKLSRGQKQKLAICIALIADPPVVLLDEPTTGLDVQSARAIKDKIIEMTKQQGKTVLVTTHDMHVAQELCDRIGIISEGRLVACKSTEQLIDLFSDFTFVFHLNSEPDVHAFGAIPGVASATIEHHDGEPALVIGAPRDSDQRSECIYAVIEKLRANGHRIRGMTQRKQNLEDVFLRLTEKNGS